MRCFLKSKILAAAALRELTEFISSKSWPDQKKKYDFKKEKVLQRLVKQREKRRNYNVSAGVVFGSRCNRK